MKLRFKLMKSEGEREMEIFKADKKKKKKNNNQLI